MRSAKEEREAIEFRTAQSSMALARHEPIVARFQSSTQPSRRLPFVLPPHRETEILDQGRSQRLPQHPPRYVILCPSTQPPFTPQAVRSAQSELISKKTTASLSDFKMRSIAHSIIATYIDPCTYTHVKVSSRDQQPAFFVGLRFAMEMIQVMRILASQCNSGCN